MGSHATRILQVQPTSPLNHVLGIRDAGLAGALRRGVLSADTGCSNRLKAVFFSELLLFVSEEWQ